MLWTANTYLLYLLFVSVVVYSIALPLDSGVVVRTPAISRRNEHVLPITFEAACNGCFDDAEQGVIFYLDVLSTKSVCGESRVRLNGRDLKLHWDGTTAAGETNITSKLSNARKTTSLFMSFRALCVSSPVGSVEDYAAQILTVTFHPAGRVDENNEASGFALSFNSVGKPEIFRLSTSPVSISEHDTSFESWLNSSGSDEFHVQSYANSDATRIVNLEDELQQLHLLRQEAQRIETIIREKDQRIRMHLLDDCTCLSSMLQKCKTLSCFAEVSFKLVPDLFRLMKYRFGTLPPTLSGAFCPSLVGDSGGRNITTGSSASTFSNSSQVTVEGRPTNAITHRPKTPGGSVIVTPQSTQHIVGVIVVVLLLIATIAFVFKTFRDSISCRRRRVDLAARREERRARQAYRAAACRYRFSLWWTELWNCLNGASSPQSSHFQRRFNTPNGADNIFIDPRRPVPLGAYAMQNEIVGFRRALEYVGQLVQINSPPEQRRASQDIAEIGAMRASDSTPTILSSIAPLTTIASPSTSTIFSYETDETGTIESIDLETATMVSG
ncbi:hypothetical protein LOZ53_002326 [Ophidiomyces ophidiicola]|nr:hypothetical protein LOZ55_004415 [Ophidiomyces ophidiicola]KAI1986421.1 hypothetical protein LOZ51_006013 [Ophidiomyces ophidiicola]KAI1990127.1 hypothetical protein LOZ54_002621 [Ophidiomyces ophidiicola]KAI1992760.1 hypothetical protein LOZ53_002326 [Ophidiomyces ophidiicola]